jgi:hypothetical protein
LPPKTVLHKVLGFRVCQPSHDHISHPKNCVHWLDISNMDCSYGLSSSRLSAPLIPHPGRPPLPTPHIAWCKAFLVRTMLIVSHHHVWYSMQFTPGHGPPVADSPRLGWGHQACSVGLGGLPEKKLTTKGPILFGYTKKLVRSIIPWWEPFNSNPTMISPGCGCKGVLEGLPFRWFGPYVCH